VDLAEEILDLVDEYYRTNIVDELKRTKWNLWLIYAIPEILRINFSVPA
jgi:hypothetical protein